MSDYDGMRLIADSPLDAGEGVGHFHQVPTPPPDWMPERFGCPKDAPPAELYRAKTALLNTRTARLAASFPCPPHRRPPVRHQHVEKHTMRCST